MKTFKQFIKEARRNPEQNPKISAYDALKKYKDDPDVYITFTEVDKVGINPKSEFNTPLGIYTYPLKEIWKKNIEPNKKAGNVPFAGERPYIYVLKLIDNKHFINNMYSDYGSNLYDKDIEILHKYWNDSIEKDTSLSDKDRRQLIDEWTYMVQESIKTAREKNPIMSFWNLTRILAGKLSINYKSIAVITIWNKLLRLCGYSGFADKDGKGYIHPAEPIQAVFLSTAPFKVIDKILNKEYESKNVFTIDKHLIVYDGISINVESLKLKSLKGSPKEVGGDFVCYNNQLTSLEGAPEQVGGDFDCSLNKLTSLEGAPKEVGKIFDCSDNQLTSLEGAPEKVGGDFDCSDNQLTSLEGAPEKVGGDFKCQFNKLTSLKGAPKEVGKIFSCYWNQLTSLEGAPEKVGGDFNCSNNKLTSLEGAPKEIGGNFDCTSNKIKFTEEQVRAVCNVKGKIYV